MASRARSALPSAMSLERSVGRVRAARLLAGLALFALAHATLAQPPNYRLEVDAPEALVAPISTQTLLGRWRDDPEFERDQLALFVERARDEARAIAQAAGYFSASVTVTLDEASTPPVIRVRVDAGALTTVNRFRLELRGQAADEGLAAALRDRWPLPEGSFFRASQWELGKRQLLEQLQQRGYLRAAIAASSARVDPEATTASLDVVVDSGTRLRFGAATLRGLARYPRSIVDALRPWDEGDPYAYDAVLAYQDRIREEGHFTSATVLPDLTAIDEDPQRIDVPVTVELRERQAQRVTLGLGFSTDQGPRGLIGYEHHNVLGRGWTAETGALVERVRRRLFATGRTPFDADGHRYQAGARSERWDVSGELTDTNTFYVGRGKRVSDVEYFLSLQYQTERRAIDAPGEAITGRRAALSLAYAWNLRRLDSRIDPRSGYTISAQVSGGVKGAGSDRTFARLYGRAMRFWSMPQESVLGGGLLVGLVEAGMVVAGSRDDIPSENLFRAGGSHSIRGYRFLGLGVREGNAIVGGRVLALASLEYQHPITPTWSGAVFVDVGNADDRWDRFKAVRGTGLGVRWRSPVGPINLDVAYGEAVRRWRGHFSVGYTF